jgi:thiamine biosynthesis lipoprotein
MATTPTSYHTLRLETRAMGCTWAVILNPGAADELMHASSALNAVYPLEQKMSTFRADSDLSQLNRAAAITPHPVNDDLFEVLDRALRLARETEGAFDPTSRPLSLLWRRCRDEQRIPTSEEIAATLMLTGHHRVRLDSTLRTVSFQFSPTDEAGASTGMELDLGAIGKGFAIDRAARVLCDAGVADFLIHGGYSSVFGAGVHFDQPGWPVGLKNPLLEQGDYATVFLRDQGLSTSGANVQFFRHGGRRYGHILDPRSGWPAEGLLSVTVLAPAATDADALSTALYVMGFDAAVAWCERHPEIGAILVPTQMSSRVLKPTIVGIPRGQLVFQGEDIAPDWHPSQP